MDEVEERNPIVMLVLEEQPINLFPLYATDRFCSL